MTIVAEVGEKKKDPVPDPMKIGLRITWSRENAISEPMKISLTITWASKPMKTNIALSDNCACVKPEIENVNNRNVNENVNLRA